MKIIAGIAAFIVGVCLVLISANTRTMLGFVGTGFGALLVLITLALLLDRIIDPSSTRK